MKQPIIEMKQISYSYDQRNVIEDINLTVEEGNFLGLVGPNGSGKTTLLKCILGLIKPQQGELLLFGVPVKKFKEWNKIGFVSQKANSFNTGFPASVYEVVASGLTAKLGLFKRMSKTDKQKVLDAIESVGISSLKDKNIGELSGGQQQRTFIARALVSEPKLLILDEPTVGVDQKTVEGFYRLLEKLNRKKGITLILVTHDVGTVSDKVTHVACLNKHLHFHGDTEEFETMTDQDLSHFYGHDVQAISHNHHEHGGQQ
ncbi:metal ABC transporter ATP-binding protein [Bacillus sp. CLL-7-23]|uniref:Metal ABC transporter ATP-binding protein n=1 Tax=Bacillus changyiensis TaxID=3004103 RepID=A0ABT4X3R9_9BACI|nr:metal ABC transporter ATP-binding protein [Bacillus changyiensis]MDA7026923.1 metal ABC transporter ATP-binding protein [Bacillus changyiensis]